jgi:hypothetical protein
MAKNTVIVALLGLLSVTLVASQATGSGLVRFGKVGLALTDAEVVQITNLANNAGSRPWLLLGQGSMMPGRQSASLFLESDVLGARVMRGRMLRLVADGPPTLPVRSAWRIEESRRYAYIPTQGRQPKDISSESDIDWPFTVDGEFDDDTLVSVVEFVRSNPRVPMRAFAQHISRAPISVIARRDDGILVAQRTSEWTGDQFWLNRKDGQWVITRSESWIV